MCSEARAARRTGLAVACLLVAALAGCGKQGPPLPPLSPVPAATRDLEVRQRGGDLVLDLAYPQTTAAGLALPGLEAVEIWQVARPLPPPDIAPPPLTPREFEPQARLLATISGAELAAAVAGDRLRLRLPAEGGGATPERILAVRLVGPGRRRSAFSNLAGLVTQTPPAAPAEFSLAPGADGIEVRWSEVPGALGYRVYRRDPRSRSWGQPVASVLAAAERRFVDAGARFGERYVYTVTAAASPKVESAPAGEREIEYLDRFGPPAPATLAALPEEGRVRLTWEASPAADLAGYVVERRAEDEAEFAPLTAAPLPGLEYVDEGLAPGARYRYRVLARDQAGNAGAPSVEVVAVVR